MTRAAEATMLILNPTVLKISELALARNSGYRKAKPAKAPPTTIMIHLERDCQLMTLAQSSSQVSAISDPAARASTRKGVSVKITRYWDANGVDTSRSSGTTKMTSVRMRRRVLRLKPWIRRGHAK